MQSPHGGARRHHGLAPASGHRAGRGQGGEFTVYNSNCRKTTYAAGTAFSESSAVHVGRNEGTMPVGLVATFAAQANRALTLDRPNPGCTVD